MLGIFRGRNAEGCMHAIVLINEMYLGQSKNYPTIVQVEPLPYQTAGATRELFAKP